MKVIGIDIKDWQPGDLASRIAGLLGLRAIAHEHNDGFVIGDTNDFWLCPSTEKSIPGAWEIHARYPHVIMDSGVRQALVVLLRERLHIRDAFAIDWVTGSNALLLTRAMKDGTFQSTISATGSVSAISTSGKTLDESIRAMKEALRVEKK